jgi:hypothetical protein
VSQSKIFNLANLKLFGATLLAITYSFNTTRSEARSLLDTFNYQLLSPQRTSTYQNLANSQNSQKTIAPQTFLAQDKNKIILADNPDLAVTNSDRKASKAKLIRLTSRFFLLLFFVPLGIFYPLFLFYRMLLVNSNESDDILNSDRENELPESLNSIDSVLQAETDVNQATVSKLQIAFAPPASQLREELNRVTLMTHLNEEYDLVDFTQQAVNVLIAQGHWTHASYSSITLPLEKVRAEFDLVLAQEKTKLANKTLSLVNYNHDLSDTSNNDSYLESFSYVVVTLILCTSQTIPLFQKISTKEQLVQELSQLSEIKRESMIKFELFWNPQQEGVYLSNTQLLTEYAHMTRLL